MISPIDRILEELHLHIRDEPFMNEVDIICMCVCVCVVYSPRHKRGEAGSAAQKSTAYCRVCRVNSCVI